MNNLPAITKEFTAFVARNLKENPSTLRLRHYGKSENFDVDFAIVQIECRQKTKKKLKTFIAHDNFIFPTQLSAEQASNEAVARYHASLADEGSTLLDMTAGLGIDVMSMSRHCNQVTACELDELKAEALKHNCKVLGLHNISVVTGDSSELLLENENRFDIIFIDPARRGEDNARTYNFHDCQPDILKLQKILPAKTNRLLIKASPLLDISQTIKDINSVRSIRAICVHGECKEVLVEAIYSPTHRNVEAMMESGIIKEAIDLNEDGSIISRFSYSEYSNQNGQAEEETNYAMEGDIKPESYLYEPNAAIMKFAPWNELCRRFEGMKKLAPSSHLFASKKQHVDFPGRILKIERIIEKKDRKTLKNLPVNVTVRNYPLSAVELRKQLKVKEGSDLFIYGTRISAPLLILAKRVSTYS